MDEKEMTKDRAPHALVNFVASGQTLEHEAFILEWFINRNL